MNTQSRVTIIHADMSSTIQALGRHWREAFELADVESRVTWGHSGFLLSRPEGGWKALESVAFGKARNLVTTWVRASAEQWERAAQYARGLDAYYQIVAPTPSPDAIFIKKTSRFVV